MINAQEATELYKKAIVTAKKARLKEVEDKCAGSLEQIRRYIEYACADGQHAVTIDRKYIPMAYMMCNIGEYLQEKCGYNVHITYVLGEPTQLTLAWPAE